MGMDSSHDAWIEATCYWLSQAVDATNQAQVAEKVDAGIATAEPPEVERLLTTLVTRFNELSSHPPRLRMLMQALAARLLQLLSETIASSADELSAGDHNAELEALREQPLVSPATLTDLYQRLSEVDEVAAAHALQMLAAQPDEESIDLLADLLSHSPPDDWQQVALALSPLWRADSETLALFYERLDTGSLHPSTLAILIDLAGYSQRKGKLAEHPWQMRQAELVSLLGSVCQRLQMLEREPAKFGDDVQQVQRVLNDSVSLTISLCDALGLIGDQQTASAVLLQAMQLSHRRIQTEAAAALVRLGVSEGQQRLLALASDPAARLRAVSYAEELDCAELIGADLRSPQALAEAELASWLTSPEQFGIPPQRIELLDSRTLYWPGYEEPQACYLFRYEYDLPSGQVSNLGIAGPATHAFTVDLTRLPIDDVYAIFAGWQVEHEDIFEIPMTQLNVAQRSEADRLIGCLNAQQLHVTETIALTFFLGEVALIAEVDPMEAEGQRASGHALTDGIETLHIRTQGGPAALTPAMIVALYRGRKLLRTFNP